MPVRTSSMPPPEASTKATPLLPVMV